MATSLEKTRARLRDVYGDSGEGAADRLETWMSGQIELAHPDVLAAHLERAPLDLVYDAFRAVLPLGTGGRRGRVGYGPNRFNDAILALSVQGHCAYLRARFGDRGDLAVVVANDVRAFRDISGVYRFLGPDHPLIGVSSRSLARLACEIYAGNGIRAYLARPDDPSGVMSTPELAYLVRRLGAAGGVNLSASHNPPDDNGIKLYDERGAQPVPPEDEEFVKAMRDVDRVSRIAFAEARAQGFVDAVPEAATETYYALYLDAFGGLHDPDPELPVTFTPLCGVALGTAGALLERAGFPVITPPDEHPDATFGAIPFKQPNPEFFSATGPARAFADRNGSRVVLSCDPDADRLGCEIKDRDGHWIHLDGNQIAAILCYYLMLDAQGPKRRGLVIETMVTTRLLAAIAARAEGSWAISDLPVGFKYVAEVLRQLEETGRYEHVECRPEALVLAAEESHGYATSCEIRDKDASSGAILLAGLYQRLAREGRTLLDYYVDILGEIGAYAQANRSIVMAGAEGAKRRDAIMDTLRSSPPSSLAGAPVANVCDFWDEARYGPLRTPTDELSRNILEFETARFIVTIRPSGTEPKLKLYCQILPGGAPDGVSGTALLDALGKRADEIVSAVYADVLALIGVELGDAALALPDIIELDRKREFDEKVLSAKAPDGLRAALVGERFVDAEALLAWLRDEAAPLLPGADPLPAIKPCIAHLLHDWAADLPSSPPVRALRTWAAG